MLFSGQQVSIDFNLSGTYQLQLKKSNSCGTLITNRELIVQNC